MIVSVRKIIICVIVAVFVLTSGADVFATDMIVQIRQPFVVTTYEGDFDFQKPTTVTGILASGEEYEIPVVWDMSEFYGVYGHTYQLRGSLAADSTIDFEIMEPIPSLTVVVAYAREDDVSGEDLHVQDEKIELRDIRLEFFVNSNVYGVIDYSGTMRGFTMDVNTLLNDRGDRTLIPIRFFAETLNYQVHYEPRTQTIAIMSEHGKNRESGMVLLQIGSRVILVDGRSTVMDTPVEEHNWRTYLPLRYVGEAFGFEVEWDEVNQKAILVGQSPTIIEY